MRIHNINNYISYNGSTKPLKHEDTIKSKNYDVIEINKNKIEQDKNDLKLEKIKKDIAAHINEATSDEKIAKIKESVKNKTYDLGVDEIVKRLLDK